MLTIVVKIILITSVAYARNLEKKPSDHELELIEGEQGQTVQIYCDLEVQGRSVLVWKQGKRQNI